MHKRIELCENVLAIINSERYLHKERGYETVICINNGDRNLLRDQDPIVCLNSGARNLLSA